MTDEIRLRGIEVFAHHGVLDHERELGQPFLVDVTIELDLGPAAASDDLGSTIDYGTLAATIHDRVAGETFDLIESVAGRVADLVLEDPAARAVEVVVTKPRAPFTVPVGSVAVVVRRRR